MKKTKINTYWNAGMYHCRKVSAKQINIKKLITNNPNEKKHSKNENKKEKRKKKTETETATAVAVGSM